MSLSIVHLGSRLRSRAMRRRAEPAPEAGQETGWDAAVSTEGGTHFRPDIEGLRAVAILAVLAHHTGLPLISGGFVGVDIFFVISGFLITGLLVREVTSTGGVSLPDFYSRRARRLLPAALLVIVVSVIAAWAILPSVDVPSIAGDGAAAALYVSNYRFALTATDYFAQGAAPSPLLHYWSLGVEEQFYLFWPLLVLVSARWLSLRRLWWVLAAVAVASLAMSAVITEVQAPWAFYSLPTRAWELALGALVAVGVLGLPKHWPAAVATAIGLAGAGMVLASLLLISGETPFPGYAALLPAGGAVALIVAGDRPHAWTSRILAMPLPRWFGRISYSLYLWHWPLLILGPQLMGSHGLRTRLGLAVASILVAALSERFIERPFRFGWPSRWRAPRMLVSAGVACLLVALVTGVGIGTVEGGPPQAGSLPSLPPESAGKPPLLRPVVAGPIPTNLLPPLSTARSDGAGLGQDGCLPNFTDSQPDACVYGEKDGHDTVVLYGDSHAEVWLPAIKALAAERDWRIVVLIKPACTFLELTVWSVELKRPFSECDQWRAAALQRIAAEHPAITFVASSLNYSIPTADDRRPFRADEWRDAMTAALERLRSLSGRVVMFAETPHHGKDPVACLARVKRVEGCARVRGQVNERYAAIERQATHAAGVPLLPVDSWLCPRGICALILDRYLAFRDAGHLTATMTYMLMPQFRWALDHPPAHLQRR